MDIYYVHDMYHKEPQKLKPKDPRYPGLWLEQPTAGAKKNDPESKLRITADDPQFDIFKVPQRDFLDVDIPMLPVQPFTEYTEGVAFLDCEWIGPDGEPATGTRDDVLVAIGVKNRGRSYLACNKQKDEKSLLEWFIYKLLPSLEIHTIAGYASYGFFRGDDEVMVDLAMIYHRCAFHGISDCPWKPKQGKWGKYRWNNAIVFGKPLETPAWECSKYELIDIYPQIVSYDSLVRKLDNYRLKDSVIGFGLREDRRIEIGHQINEYWERGDIETIKEYLGYDLDDTKLLWDFLIPQKYFMKTYMDWSLQRITTTGTGSWWNAFLKNRTGLNPQKTETCYYQGALTYYHAGAYRNCVKFDFGSLYPSIMLTWLCCGSKDENYMALKTLQFLLNYRRSIKKSDAFRAYDSGNITPDGIDANGRQLTAKILANSLYGLWNTRGLGFNDPYAGAAITAYGRNLARYLIEWLEAKGCNVIALDTDGCCLNLRDDNFTDEERDRFFKELEAEMNETLPGINTIEYEEVIPFLFVPPNLKNNKANSMLADKLNSMECYDYTPDELQAGLSKNYIYFKQTKKGLKVVKKGKYKKRDKSWLESGFPIELITIYKDDEEKALKFAIQVRDGIESGDFPLEKLQKTVLVAASWKDFPANGFPVGSKPTVHYVWKGQTTGSRVIKKRYVPCDDPSVPYSIEYYLDRFYEIVEGLPVDVPRESDQLCLL